VSGSLIPAVIPLPAWVLLRRLRYAYVSMLGTNKLANETIGVSWRRDAEVVRVIKRAAAQPPQRIHSDAEFGDLWKTALGEFWIPPGASADFVMMLSIEVLSDTYHFSAQTWNAPPIVLDCGANVGMFARLALGNGAKQVICCEPSPRTAACLERTFKKESQSGHLKIVKKAVWDKPETLYFWAQNQDNPGSHRVIGKERPGNVPIDATTIDAIVEELNLPAVDFIKMDIEGAEIHALRGAADTIRRFRPVIGVGTEHTSDIAANNESVIRTLRTIDSTYRCLCTEVHAERSPSRGLILVPYSLFFY
jgi:FkbM family methyltransferase